MPADALTTSEPAQLRTISTAALGIVGAVQGRDWEAADAITKRIGSVASSLPRKDQPGLVIVRLDSAIAALTRAVRARDVARAGTSAIAASQSVLDLQLQYRPVTEIDRGRLELWSYQILIDATGRDGGSVSGDVATLEWVRDRFAHALEPAEAEELDARLRALRIADRKSVV